MLTKLQKQKINHFFLVCDVDRDAHLTAADLDRVARNLAAARGHAEGSPPHQRVRERYGAWGDAAAPFMIEGRLSMRAHLAWHEALLADRAGADRVLGGIAEVIFDLLDDNGDGRISSEEFASFYRAYEIAEGVAGQAFARLDRDGDGSLSREEVLAMTREFYLSDDPNAPGNWLFGPWDGAPVAPA